MRSAKLFGRDWGDGAKTPSIAFKGDIVVWNLELGDPVRFVKVQKLTMMTNTGLVTRGNPDTFRVGVRLAALPKEQRFVLKR